MQRSAAAWALIAIAGFTGPAGADGQLEYGQYLAGECTSCHRLDGADKGIPSIVGWDKASFVAVMKSFKSGERSNPAMVSVAKGLDDTQIDALAAYFATLQVKTGG